MNYNFIDGTLCYINFKGNMGCEINSIHLGVLFNLPGLDSLVFCIPLTSPKLKHFKNELAYYDRNYHETKHFSWQYLGQTDSIALLEQMKTISKNRIKDYYKNQDGKIIVLTDFNKKVLKEKIIGYLDKIIYFR